MFKKTYVIDGMRFHDMDGFYDEIGEQLIPETYWGRNLDAFNDILRGNFGPLNESDFVLIWKNSGVSKDRLGIETFDLLVEIIHDHDQIQLILE